MKKIKVFLILALVISIVATGCTTNEASADTWGQIEDRGKIIVGLDDTFVPMGSRDNAGNLVGFDVDMAIEAIGRLDKDTVGLLLLTNDGELNHRLISPKWKVDKVYYAKIDKKVTDEDIHHLMLFQL